MKILLQIQETKLKKNYIGANHVDAALDSTGYMLNHARILILNIHVTT